MDPNLIRGSLSHPSPPQHGISIGSAVFAGSTVKARKLAYYGNTMRKQGSCLEKEIMQGTIPGARRRGISRTAWMDNIKTWTGLSVEESIRMTEDRCVHAGLLLSAGVK